MDSEHNRDRAAIITGAGQGIGRAFALRLAACGHPVAVVDVHADKAEAVADEVRDAGGRALALACDVADETAVQAMVEAVSGDLAAPAILVNNASIFSTLTMRPFFEIPTAEWRKVIDVNMTSVFLCARHAQAAMRAVGWGRIVNISSAVVPMGRANYLHYVASKAGVVGMTRAMARELGDFGITVNAILPGATETEIPRETVSAQQREAFIAMRALKRAQTPQDLAGVLAFLCSDDAGFMTGQSLIVDGGIAFA